ncbi:hypothetical protein TMPK1_03570 [Rhodospirillales bacterium TMPK1]|uniref:Uncharacterized protein n=2 Tax=Roseiterribacter gracilis TaxID=2812848 RepID=A0A8S8XA78_9PROT|nr:hypothetical protein TMPK1_03570 [Rhodospirillales bacterium TMPK1]
MGEVIRFPIERRGQSHDGIEPLHGSRLRVRSGGRKLTLRYVEAPAAQACIVDVPFPAAWDDGDLIDADELDRALDHVAVWCAARARRIRLSWSYSGVG